MERDWYESRGSCCSILHFSIHLPLSFLEISLPSLVSIESRRLLIYQRFGFRVSNLFPSSFADTCYASISILPVFLHNANFLPSLLGRAVENSRVFDSREGLLEKGRRKLVNATETFHCKMKGEIVLGRARDNQSCVNNWFGYIKMNPVFVVVDGNNRGE